MIFATAFGSVAAIATSSAALTQVAAFTGLAGAEAFQAAQITLTLNNNNSSGFKATFGSANSSKLINGDAAYDAAKDGHSLGYKMACPAVGSPTNSAAVAATVIGATGSPTIMLSAVPTAATVNGSALCVMSLGDDEALDELLAGTLTDTITVVYSNI